MKQIARIISTYTADVSGVCSALYELGGMVVMHDPSGCNSTYNTHDEPRWYHIDSLIFISGLAEMDAIMGNDDKLIDDVVAAAGEFSPKFIALARTPIPMLNGTDFDAIASVITKRTGTPAFYFPTNGTHSYVIGAGMALEKIVDYYTDPAQKGMADPAQEGMADQVQERITDQVQDIVTEKSTPGINLLGVTPLDFSINGTVESMKKFIQEEGFELISCLAMGSSLPDIARAGQARVNLVVSSVGIPAAKVLERKFGIPYVVGTPIGRFARTVAEDLRDAMDTGKSMVSCVKRPPALQAEIAVVGEAVVSGSLAAVISQVYGRTVRVICPLEADAELFVDGDQQAFDEDDLEQLLMEIPIIIADPMYRPICPAAAKFYELPHEAFSGRIYRKNIPDLVKMLN